MPAFESLMLAEKTVVVFDIGTVYTKCGFAGESCPRFILPTKITLAKGTEVCYNHKMTKKSKKDFFTKFLHLLYYRHLLVNPKDRRVLIVESVLTTTESRNILADVLFNHFEVSSALFAPAHLLSLFTLGISTGLVLDCGYEDAVVIPVCEGFTLLNAWQSGPLGSKEIHKNLKEQLFKHARITNTDHSSQNLSIQNVSISEETLEDIKVRTCFITPESRAKLWNEIMLIDPESNAAQTAQLPELAESHFTYALTTEDGGSCLQIPSQIRETAAEVLFTGDNDEITLATLLLQAVLLAPLDERRNLVSNIVLIGGTCNIPGFTHRLLEELEQSLELPRFSQLRALKDSFKFHQSPANYNFVAWLGGAIFGALESLPGRSISRTAYLEKGLLPDWTSIIETETDRHDRT